MNLAEIESELQALSDQPFDKDSFALKLLEIYHAPKATLTKLKQGSSNYATGEGELLWKNRLFFRSTNHQSLADAVDDMRSNPLVARHKPRLIMAVSPTEFFCYDSVGESSAEGDLSRLNDHFLFFLPLAGFEKYEAPTENPADVKATSRVARLYDAILEANSDWTARDYTHDLNQFMTRILFCFFAEDTGIFTQDSFTSTVVNYSREDGSDVSDVLSNIFSAMDLKPDERVGLPEFANRFPYVNGGLFQDRTETPKFSKRARRLLKECGELYWKDINPDIFGSMVQVVCQPGLREDMGLHYTSVPNIMKALRPLILNSLEEDFIDGFDSEVKLKRLLERIYSLRIFDPACGSGNFLIIAYKELRALEMRVFKRLDGVARQRALPLSGVHLTQFYGIELTDFAAETAKLSLWIAEYQMNELFKATFGSAPPTLPLRDSGQIHRGNAAQLSWLEVCPPDERTETIVVGNPPFEGARGQSDYQKADIQAVMLPSYPGGNSLDYVSIWFHLAANYLGRTPGHAAFVATSSLCEGQSVPLFWGRVIERQIEISFAHTAFKWRNNAGKNAAVTCVIVGIRLKSSGRKTLYSGDLSKVVGNISPYLTDTDNIIVQKQSEPPIGAPPLVLGNQAIDDGHLILTKDAMEELVSSSPSTRKFMRPLYGANDFIEGTPRFCIWVSEVSLAEAQTIPAFADRFEKVRKYRETGGEVARSLVGIPYRFRYVHEAREYSIVVPRYASERRVYLSCGILDREAIVTDAVQVIYDPPIYLFSILSSKIHMSWLKAVGGKFKTDPRYSNTLVYNTFPFPSLSESQKSVLAELAYEVIAAREAHPGRSLTWLYDPKMMPSDLAAAHERIDEVLEDIYIGRRFRTDAERLAHLFKLYAAKAKKASKGKPPAARKAFA